MAGKPYSPGERVRIRLDFPPGHIRTPVYVRGKIGVVTKRLGEFTNPELAAYRLQGPPRALYQIRFRQTELWPEYEGPGTDTIDLDLYEHWLEKA